ncbi:MAG TPA: IS21 family transposase [Acidothermaceae bacterium]
MKSARERMDIISAYREVGTYRGAAVVSGTTPKTVKRVIARHDRDQASPAGGSLVRVGRERNYSSVTVLVAERVEKTRGRISAKRLLPTAQAAGYGGSARNFRRLVAEQKALWCRDNPRGRRPAVWSPGEHLVIDWGVLDGLHVFCAVLAWSRVRFVRFAEDERAETTMGMLAECFEQLGGVPAVVLADRMGCLKGGVVANVVVPTPDYVGFAAHYGFRPDFCEAADPESKGIVENLVGYAKTDLMIPSTGEHGVAFSDLVAANAAAVAWCMEVNGVEHSEICAVPAERLRVEQELLATLPSLRPSLGRSVTRKVDRLSCVRFASARYSVPTRLIGTQVTLRVEADRSVAIMAGDGVVICEHMLVAPGEASVRDEHYGVPRPAPRRAVRPKTQAEKDFCALGPVAEVFITGAAASGNTRLGPELGELNQLRAAHGAQAFLAALDRAVAFGRWRAADVRSILAAGGGTSDPRPAGDALILELPVVPVRSLADYAISPARGART